LAPIEGSLGTLTRLCAFITDSLDLGLFARFHHKTGSGMSSTKNMGELSVFAIEIDVKINY
jgi:hypothetical protein